MTYTDINKCLRSIDIKKQKTTCTLAEMRKNRFFYLQYNSVIGFDTCLILRALSSLNISDFFT